MQHVMKLSPMAYAKKVVHNPTQFSCLKELWTRESHWNFLARNKQPVYQIRDGKRVALHAFGIAQLLGEKSHDPRVQIDKGLRYISHRYSSPCHALNWHNRRNWY